MDASRILIGGGKIQFVQNVKDKAMSLTAALLTSIYSQELTT